MKKYNYHEIDILIADQNIQLRGGLKGILHQAGFRSIQDVSNHEQLENALMSKSPDLLLCDIRLPGGDVCETIGKLRHNQCGFNPFCSVILFIDEPTQDVVARASKAGLDDLQIKPIVAKKILARVEYLVEKRKPFVVTTDYIGPDRRTGHRPGTMEISTVEVPNSIQGKATGNFNEREFRDHIEKSVWEINAQKIERQAYQIAYLVDRIVPAYQDQQFNKESMGQCARLVDVSKDIAKRLEDSDFDHLSGLVSTLETVAESLWKSGTLPKQKDLELLPELSAAISATFKSVKAAAPFADEIIHSVQDQYKK
ncbi:putative Response regulator consisting of a CheY-like receiver domain [Candidatus Terasakiella magnetica]|uniref:Putative Response regulator consisting of a CheY-like receiver domain n=1 Tax=Candidatus Terasakiella magnetica TaxID=1867952 RepID=A0A1C3RD62_9PROT|nr:response regulator [Candidatus Terasakiella magnetica]SCA55233.1 putative Response regulator consisting of a CheY-like receiver domain [Candidatus Terasakiella magnetica]